MAPSGALSLQYNTVVVHVSGSRVRLDPPCPHLEVERGRTHGPVFVSTRAEGDKTIVRVDGRARGAVKIRRRIANPGQFTASVFATALGRPDIAQLVDLTATYGMPTSFEGRHLMALKKT